MAPRGRSRKVFFHQLSPALIFFCSWLFSTLFLTSFLRGFFQSRDTRMDAAVDAMTKNYGIPEEIVKRVAKELHKVHPSLFILFFPPLLASEKP